jgi:hypothetical protein
MAIIVGQRISNLANSTTVSTATTGYVVHTFSTPGSMTLTSTGSGSIVDILVVGGGGGAGLFGPARTGGGGGSVLYAKNIPLIGGVSYPITIGSGGIFATSSGGPTIFNYNGGSITSPGGAQGSASNPLGSGGGGGGLGANVIGLGFNGGVSPSPRIGSSGGGAASAGGTGAAGGAGLIYNISGTSACYGGGGGGGGPGSTTGPIDVNSTPTDFGLGGGSPTGQNGNPGCIIIRYIG